MNSAPTNQIVYYCGNGMIEWDPEDKSLGGSEQAVVQLSERWAKMKYIVTIYGRVASKVVNGVCYRKSEEFDPSRDCNIFIIWRECGINTLGLMRPKARAVLLDLHDFSPEEKIMSYASYVNVLMLKSEYHSGLYPNFPSSKKHVKPNGIQTNAYDEMRMRRLKREPLRFCYTASYDRGLRELLRYSWPEIHRQLPGSQLHVYYGIASWDPKGKETEELLNQPGVIHHGRRPNGEVAEEKFRSSMNLYPSHCLTEIDCINVRESALAGCIPVLSNMAVFAERDGVHLVGDAEKPEFHKNYVTLVVNLAKSPEKQEHMRNVLEKSDLIFTWNPVAEDWHRVIQKELTDAKCGFFF
jgi:hypothetical protein